MRRKISLPIGLLLLLSLLVLFLHWSGGQRGIRRAGAVHLGSSWSAIENISNSPAELYGNSQHPCAAMAAGGADLHVTWMEGVNGGPPKGYGPAYVKGQSGSWPICDWSNPGNPCWITTGKNPDYSNPTIALDSLGNPHVVWIGNPSSPYDIFYATRSGTVWTPPYNLTNIGGQDASTFYPSIAIDSQDTIWVVWQIGVTLTDDDLYVRSKPAAGDWSSATRLPVGSKKDQNPIITIGKNDVPYIVWRSTDGLGGKFDIYYTKFEGGSWSAPFNISATSGDSYHPRIVADKNTGDLFVVWWEDEGNDVFQIRFRRYDAAQSLWQDWKQVSQGTSKAEHPSIAADGCTLYVAWEDYREGSYPEIYFSHSTDCGATWPTTNEDASRTDGKSSYWPDVVAQPGGYAHVFWQDNFPGQLDIYYAKASLEGAATPTPTYTPTPEATPDLRPYGWVLVAAQQPPADLEYTSQPTVTLMFSATSPLGNPLQMRYDNYADFHTHPNYEPFSTPLTWALVPAGSPVCEPRSVYAQFKDGVAGYESQVVADNITYDNYLEASMVLNGGNEYVNRIWVMVTTEDLDGQTVNCSGLDKMAFSTDGTNFTTQLPYFHDFYYFMPPAGDITRTVYARYWDRAGNMGTYLDTILLDTTPPTGTAPVLSSPTSQLIVPVSNLQGWDDASGIAAIWMANRPTGPWLSTAYCASPPCTWNDWNLAYGGPPIISPDLHHVYVKYEDDTGYGPYAGNFSPVYSGTVEIYGVANIFLPLVGRSARQAAAAPISPASQEAHLILLADPPRAGPGQEVLLYLAVLREEREVLEGTLRLTLPPGLRAVGAWSLHGRLLQVSEHVVTSHERAWDRQVPYIVVQAHREGRAEGPLEIQGSLTWDGGTITAAPVWVADR